MGRRVCTEPQCLYKGDLYFTLVIGNKSLSGQTLASTVEG